MTDRVEGNSVGDLHVRISKNLVRRKLDKGLLFSSQITSLKTKPNLSSNFNLTSYPFRFLPPWISSGLCFSSLSLPKKVRVFNWFAFFLNETRGFWSKHRRKVFVTAGCLGSGYFLYKLYNSHTRRLADLQRQLANDREHDENIKAQLSFLTN